MYSKSRWMFLLILQCGIVTPRPPLSQVAEDLFAHQQYNYDAHNKPKDNSGEQVISVRITSSVAVGRGGSKNDFKSLGSHPREEQNIYSSPPTTAYSTKSADKATKTITTEVPPNLVGANIEFIRQLNAKKEAKVYHASEQIHPFQFNHFSNETDHPLNQHIKDTNYEKTEYTISEKEHFPLHSTEALYEDSIAEPSVKKISRIKEKNYDSIPIPQSFPPIQVSKKDEADVTSLAKSPTAANVFIFETQTNDTDDSLTASTIESIVTLENEDKQDENIENVPLARSVPFSPSSKNFIQGLANKPQSERGNSASLTTVSFNILHDTPNQPANYNTASNTYSHNDQGFGESNKFYETPKVYSQPAQIYSEPAKFYSEPAKIYSEPAKIYSEPAKVYSEPAKIYSEPAKFYSQPASLHLPPQPLPNYTPWQDPSRQTDIASTILNTTPTVTLPTSASTTVPSAATAIMHHPEKSYEVDEKVSVMTDGQSHGVQESSTEKCKQDNCKVGYVVEGRQYKKYRVEERTPDGFIVGEYGVVRNEDGALRGVRYTADGDASPRLIYDALMKFLQLK